MSKLKLAQPLESDELYIEEPKKNLTFDEISDFIAKLTIKKVEKYFKNK
jgi:hypothetical protein